MLEKRSLGQSGVGVTAIGLGGAWLGSRAPEGMRQEVGVRTVLRALELGVRLIDTSGAYLGGESERIIGAALGEWFRAGGRREDLVLSTKTGTRPGMRGYDGATTRASVERSLAALGVDYIDVLHVHDPQAIEEPLAPGAAFDTLRRLQAEGLVRLVGLGVRNHAFHQRCIAAGVVDAVLTYRDMHLLDQSAREGVIAPAAVRGVGVLNGMAVLYGLLGGRDPFDVAREMVARGRRKSFDPDDPQDEAVRARRLWEFCAARGISLLALNLQYCLRERRLAAVVVGAAEPAEIEGDVQAATASLPEGVWEELRAECGIA